MKTNPVTHALQSPLDEGKQQTSNWIGSAVWELGDDQVLHSLTKAIHFCVGVRRFGQPRQSVEKLVCDAISTQWSWRIGSGVDGSSAARRAAGRSRGCHAARYRYWPRYRWKGIKICKKCWTVSQTAIFARTQDKRNIDFRNSKHKHQCASSQKTTLPLGAIPMFTFCQLSM